MWINATLIRVASDFATTKSQTNEFKTTFYTQLLSFMPPQNIKNILLIKLAKF